MFLGNPSKRCPCRLALRFSRLTIEAATIVLSTPLDSRICHARNFYFGTDSYRIYFHPSGPDILVLAWELHLRVPSPDRACLFELASRKCGSAIRRWYIRPFG